VDKDLDFKGRLQFNGVGDKEEVEDDDEDEDEGDELDEFTNNDDEMLMHMLGESASQNGQQWPSIIGRGVLQFNRGHGNAVQVTLGTPV
jgi:hypothetical protein